MFGWFETRGDIRKRRIVVRVGPVGIGNRPGVHHRDLLRRWHATAVLAIVHAVGKHRTFARHSATKHMGVPLRGCACQARRRRAHAGNATAVRNTHRHERITQREVHHERRMEEIHRRVRNDPRHGKPVLALKRCVVANGAERERYVSRLDERCGIDQRPDGLFRSRYDGISALRKGQREQQGKRGQHGFD